MGCYEVYISNITKRAVPIHPHAVLCVLQPVVDENDTLIQDEINHKTPLEDNINIRIFVLTET